MLTKDLGSFLESGGLPRDVATYRKGAKIFAQGDAANSVFYLRNGTVKLSVLSRIGREAVIGILGPGDFFGEGALAGQHIRMATAKAMSPCTVLIVDKTAVAGLLHDDADFQERFLKHMLARSIRIEADLVDQLFNSSERRLARALLLLARYGQEHHHATVPRVSQGTLAEMIGSTRTRVNYFMNKFRRMGLIEYNGGITIKPALLDVVLHDE